MKVKLKPPYELSEDEQLAVKMVRLNYHKIYEVISHNTFSYKINRKGVKLHAKKYLFNIIEEDMNPTKEQVLEAASTSKEAKNALMKLFPTYFEDDRYIYIDSDNNLTQYLCIRREGDYRFKGFYLNKTYYNWKIIRDNKGALVLVPIKKNV